MQGRSACCFEGGSSYLKLLLTEHCGELGSQVGELQHYYVSPGSYLWTQGLHNCVDYAFLFVGIVKGGGGGDGHMF